MWKEKEGKREGAGEKERKKETSRQTKMLLGSRSISISGSSSFFTFDYQAVSYAQLSKKGHMMLCQVDMTWRSVRVDKKMSVLAVFLSTPRSFITPLKDCFILLTAVLFALVVSYNSYEEERGKEAKRNIKCT